MQPVNNIRDARDKQAMAPPSGAIPLPPAERANVPEPPKANQTVYGPQPQGANNNSNNN